MTGATDCSGSQLCRLAQRERYLGATHADGCQPRCADEQDLAPGETRQMKEDEVPEVVDQGLEVDYSPKTRSVQQLNRIDAVIRPDVAGQGGECFLS